MGRFRIFEFIKQIIINMNEIKEKRLEAGLTQEQLARLADVTTVTVNRAEKKGDMKLSTYRKIMTALENAIKSN